MKGIIYYFSGTGNSYYIAKKLSQILDMKLCNINKMETTIQEYMEIGIVVPVYAAHAPATVLEHINKTVFLREQRIFTVISFAGSRGFASNEMFQTIMEKENCSVRSYKIRMPGNSVLEYGSFPKFIQKRLLHSAERKIEKIAREVMNHTDTKRISPNLLARIYYKNGVRMRELFSEKGNKFYADSTCAKCKLCKRICPVGNIEWTENHPEWGEKCQQCMACVQWCPQNAVCHPDLPKERKKYHHPCVKHWNLTEETVI